MGFFDFFKKEKNKKNKELDNKTVEEKMIYFIGKKEYQEFSKLFEGVNECENYISFKIKYLIVNNMTNNLFEVVKELNDIRELDPTIIDSFDQNILKLMQKISDKEIKENNQEEYYMHCLYTIEGNLIEEEKFSQLTFNGDENNIILSTFCDTINYFAGETISPLSSITRRMSKDFLDKMMEYNPNLILKIPNMVASESYNYLLKNDKYRKIIMTKDFIKGNIQIQNDIEVFKNLKDDEKDLFKYYNPQNGYCKLHNLESPSPYLREVIKNYSYLIRKYLCDDKEKWNDTDIEKITQIILMLTDYGNAKDIFIDEIKKGNKNIIDKFFNLLYIKNFKEYDKKEFYSKLFLLIVKDPDLVSDIEKEVKENGEITEELERSVIDYLSVIDRVKMRPQTLDEIDNIISNKDNISNTPDDSSHLYAPNGHTDNVVFHFGREVMLFHPDGKIDTAEAGRSHNDVLYRYFIETFKDYYSKDTLYQYGDSIFKMSERLALEGTITIIVENETACVYVPPEISNEQLDSIINSFSSLPVDEKASFLLWTCMDNPDKISDIMMDKKTDVMGVSAKNGEGMKYKELITRLESLRKSNAKTR